MGWREWAGECEDLGKGERERERERQRERETSEKHNQKIILRNIMRVICYYTGYESTVLLLRNNINQPNMPPDVLFSVISTHDFLLSSDNLLLSSHDLFFLCL